MVHLGDFAKRRPHELSGGMRQRVALARALAQDADVLLMDEPFGALDAMTRDLLHDELEALWTSTGKTIIFVTHNVREAVRLGDCVVLLASRPGRVAAVYNVTIPRPRRIDSSEVATLAATITDQLREEGSRGRRELTSTTRRPQARRPSCRRRRTPFWSKAWAATWPKLLAIAIVVGVWQICVWLQLRPEYVVPSPFTVFDAMFHDWHQLLTASVVTLQARRAGLRRRNDHRRRRRHRGRARQGRCAPRSAR